MFAEGTIPAAFTVTEGQVSPNDIMMVNYERAGAVITGSFVDQERANRMRKLVAAINMTLDGFCDHTAGIVDDETHQHYTELLRNSGDILYGRITYQLMESYWPSVVKNPTGNKPTDEFAGAIDHIPKLVFSRTLKNVEWETAKVAARGLEEEVLELKKRAGKDILVGSPSLIVNCLNLHLVDELQLCVHPVILGKGLPLFKDMNESINLKLLKTKTFRCGAVIFYYAPAKNDS